LLRILIRYEGDVNVVDNDLWTPLHAAATCANLEICKILIEHGADLLAVNTDGNMPYDICDDEICLEYIESEMAARGITQNTIDVKRSETEHKMLMDLKIIFLKQLNNVINICMNSIRNRTMLNTNNEAIANYLAHFRNPVTHDAKLDLNTKDMNGATLLHIACANGYNSIIEFLLIDCKLAYESGAPLIKPSLLARDNDGWTPLHIATFWGHVIYYLEFIYILNQQFLLNLVFKINL
jgi:protein phosphatase 1 regulatory subunit 16A